MEIHDKLDELTLLVEEAKAMPLSASCIVNRAQVLDLLDDIRGLLPEELDKADALLADREHLVEEGRREAARLVESAREEQAHLVSEHEVYRAAITEAEHVHADAVAEAERMRAETDDYIDGKLANFEVALHKTLQAVERGRERIRGRQAYDELGPADDPLP
ncbi:MAG: hypothetical protein R2737_08235 [Candidatus Nanopelagicales bacterium]